MSLIFPTWLQHQRAGIRNVLTTRISRAKQQSRSRGFAHEDLLAPYAMTYVSITCLMSKDFGAFMRDAGDRGDAYLLRTLQWIGQKAPFTGEVDVCRADFAFEVLGNRYAKRPGRTIGPRIYDALIASTIAVPSTPELVAGARLTALRLAKAEGRYAVSVDGGPVSFHDVCTAACTGSGNAARTARGNGTRNGTRNTRGNVTCNDGSGDRGSGSGYRGSTDPPLPPAGGEPPSGGEESGAPPGRALRPRDRERYGRVLEYVIRCGISRREPAGRSTPVALERRRELQAGATGDAEIADRLQSEYAWVTAERLARWKDGAA